MTRVSLRLIPLLLVPVILYLYKFQPEILSSSQLNLSKTNFRFPFGGSAQSNSLFNIAAKVGSQTQEITLGSFNV